MLYFYIGSAVLLGIIVVSIVFSNCFTVEQQTVRMITRFGKYNRTATTGFNFKCPFIESKSRALSLRTEQHPVTVDSITKDKVTVALKISVQSQVIPANAFEAFYKLADPVKQIESYVFDAVRSQVPEMNLDEVFQNKGEIAASVEQELRQDMAAYGFQIMKALVTEITPDPKVVAAMNDINAALREQSAAQARGEAQKTIIIKQAEAEAEQKHLRGMGVASEREVLSILMTAQGFDAMRDMAAAGKSTILFVPNSPDGFVKMFTAMAGANAADRPV